MDQTINITLPKNLLDLAESKVKQGKYASVSAVVQDALRKLTTKEIPTYKMSNKALQVADRATQTYKAGKSIEFEKAEDLIK